MSATGPAPPSPFAPADNAAVIAHINLLQGIINRLAGNSASCKTWCITLVAALLSLAGATHLPSIVTFALVPIIVFGFMDTMYLAQERAYRVLFNRVVGKVRQSSYALGDVFEASASLTFGSSVATLKSWSIFPVYGGLLLTYFVTCWFGWLNLLASNCN
jgi:uncharacterized membrane protein